MGSIVSIEGVLVAMFLALAVVFVATQDTAPSQPTAEARENLQFALADFLSKLEGMPDQDYGDRLQRFVIESLNGESDGFRTMLRQGVSRQAEYSARLRTMDGERVLFEDRPPTGEKVGWSTLFTLTQDAALIVPEVEAVDGLTMGLGYEAMLLRNGYPLRNRTIPVEVVAHLRSGNVYHAATGVYLQEGPRVSFALVVDGEETNYHPLPGEEVFKLRITEHAGHEVPAGTKLRVKLPLSWEEPGVVDESGDWREHGVTVTSSHIELSAVLVDGLTSGSVEFEFSARPPEALQDPALAVVSVDLDGGIRGLGKILHKTNGATGTLAGPAEKGVHLGFSGRMDPGSQGPWSILFANPGKDTAVRDPLTGQCIAGCETLLSVTVSAGKELFREGSYGPGWTWIDARTLRWDGEMDIGGDEAGELRPNVAVVSAVRGTRFTIEPRVAFLEADSFASNMTFRTEDALKGRVRAANDTVPGYNRTSGWHTFCSDVRVDSRLHVGCARYEVSTLPALMLLSDKVAKGLEGSEVTFENESIVSPGDFVTIQVDYRPMDGNLSGSSEYLGSDRTVIKILHPWTRRWSGLDNWTVAATWESDGPAPLLTHVWHVPPHAAYGMYVVVAERYLDFRDGKDHDQVVRRSNWVRIGHHGTDSEFIINELVVQAWLPDWG